MKKLEITDESQLYLIGYRIDSDRCDDKCDFYTLYVDDERMIDVDGFPIIFFDVNHAQKALETSNCGCEHLTIPPLDDFAYMDIAQAISDLLEEGKTDKGNIISCLNILLDFLVFLPEIRIQHEYKQRIRIAADHFTFHYEIKGFFEMVDFSRIELIQAIEWALGATLLWAKYIY